MDTGNGSPPDGGGIGGATPPPEATITAADAASTPPDPWRNPAELKKSFQKQRDLEKRFDTMESNVQKLLEHIAKGNPPPAVTPPSDEDKQPRVTAKHLKDEFEGLRAELAFEKQLNRVATGLTGKQQAALERLYKAERPSVEDVPDWLATQISDLGFVPPPSTPPAAGAKPAPSVSDTGAPARDPATVMGKGLFDLPPGAVRGMSREELRARRQYELAQGGGNNPWRK